ncbi:histidine kinase [Paeniglutamicibacter antarcticus]|uniref:histidine kinase n=1 Tax=Arthrobacter terrae TaxID=2935737 RepID=A0A931G5Y3_9MICC|nr:histidine kinase [Arthrobacter terrae]MBG0740443.1 histidine kinase [Arthrobacter terrae]
MTAAKRLDLATQMAALPRLRLKKISWAWLGFITACVALMAVGASLNVNLYRMMLPFALGMTILHTGSLALTVVRPVPGALLSLVPLGIMPLVSSPVGSAPMPFSIVAMVTQILVMCVAGLRTHWTLPAVTWLLSTFIGVAVNYRGQPAQVPLAAEMNVVVYASVSGGLMVAAVITQQWQNIRQQLLAERTLSAEEQSMRRLAEERARIARELHDVVAHGMSIVVVQATTAQYRHPDLDGSLKQEFDDIAANSRRAMTEMRSMLGALRSDGAVRDLSPKPGLTDIPQLIAAARTAGVDVSIDLDSDSIGADAAVDVSEVIGLTAYRIAQEALSNVVRHAPGAQVTVSLRAIARTLQLEISNGPSGIGAVLAQLDRTHPGQGLIGMRERASIVGGSVLCMPSNNGGYTVTATLPLVTVGTGGTP